MSLPTLIVEAAFGGTGNNTYLEFDDTTRGKFNTGTFAPSAVFTDISSYVRSVRTSRGRSRPQRDFKPGTATIELDNRDGRFDPNYASGPYVSAGVSQVVPMVPVRVAARFSGTRYELFYGYVDAWTQSYRRPHDAITTLTATDGMKILGAFTPSAAGGSVGSGEDAGARIGRLLTAAGWSTVDRALDTGVSAVQATTIAQNILTEINQVAMAEAGDFYMGADGKATFKNRQYRIQQAATASVVNGFDDQNIGPGWTDISTANDDVLIENTIAATIIGGTVQTATGSASVAKYLTKSRNETSMWLTTDAEALSWAQWALVLGKDAEDRVESIDVAPAADDTMWPWVLGWDFGQYLSISSHPPTVGATSWFVFLDGIEHSVTPMDWRTTLRFTSATKYQNGIVFDNSNRPGLDDTQYVFTY